MYFPILINWLSSFPILWLVGGNFLFLFKSQNYVLADSDQTPHHVVYDMSLQCSPSSHKKKTRLIWVKNADLLFYGTHKLSKLKQMRRNCMGESNVKKDNI